MNLNVAGHAEGRHQVKKRKTSHPFCHFVYFNVQEVQVLIEVLVFEQAFTDHLKKESTTLHHFLNTAWNTSSWKGAEIT